MARAPKPVDLQSANLTNEAKEIREEKEQKLKGNNDKVYMPPKYIKKEVKTIYKELVAELRDADILNNLDIELVSTASNAIYMMREARNRIDKLGSVIIDAGGKLVKSPYVQVEGDYHKIFHTCCLQLGLSPSSRSKLALMAAESEKDEDDGF